MELSVTRRQLEFIRSTARETLFGGAAGGGKSYAQLIDALLKLDVEGAERMALEGARHTIEKYQPRISLSAYHRSEDLYELPLLLRDMCADVRLGMRHHPYVPAWETNFYVTFG